MAKFGRAPDQLKMMAGLNPTVGRTQSEAREKFDYMQSLDPSRRRPRTAQRRVGRRRFVRPRSMGHCPLDRVPETSTQPEPAEGDERAAQRENLTIRQLYERYAGTRSSLSLVGTPTQIADEMQEWVRDRGSRRLHHPGLLPARRIRGFRRPW